MPEATARSAFAALDALFDDVGVSHLMEALVCVNVELGPAAAAAQMDAGRMDVVGAMRAGTPVGYWSVGAAEWTPFQAHELLADSSSLRHALALLEERERFFVLSQNRVTSIVTRSDLQKPAFRLYCFGIMQLLELRLLELVRTGYPDHQWRTALTDGRRKKCEELFEKRRAQREETELIDCLQTR